MMLNINNIMSNQFKAIQENPNVTRSPKMTLEFHTSIKNLIQTSLGEDYEVIAQDTREYVFSGAFLDKKVDIAILKDSKLVGAIEVKAIRSSYKKNATNYFYNMLGETANLKAGGVKVCQLIVIPEVVQFKDRGQIKTEVIGDTQLAKYYNLSLSADSQSKPDKTIVKMVNMDYSTLECSDATFENISYQGLKDYLASMSDVQAQLLDFCKGL